MRMFAFSFVVVFLLTVPTVSFAATPLSGPIVPQCNSVFQGACGFCDLFQLTQNLINFAVGFAVIVATLMFVYAGVLYFSASAKQDNIKKAHGIFWKVFIGFVFVLSAWLIVDLIMSTFLGKDFGPWNQLNCSASSSIRSAPSAPTGGITTVPSPTQTTGSGSTPQQIAFPAPVPTPPDRPWCLEVDGDTQCFSTVSGCTVAYSAAKTSGSTVSECTSQSQEPPENTSAPQEASLDEQTPEDEQTTQQEKPTAKKSYKEMNTAELTRLFYDMQASFVYRFQLENAVNNILLKGSFPWRVAVNDGAEIISLNVFSGTEVVGMVYIDKEGNQKTWDDSYGNWGTTNKDKAVTTLRGIFGEVCATTTPEDPIRNVIGC